MRKFARWTVVLLGMVLLASCSTMNDQAAETFGVAAVPATCSPVPGSTTLTALYINQSVTNQTFDNTAGCDIGIYFNGDAPTGATVDNTSLSGFATGIWNAGGTADVTDSTIVTNPTSQQHIGIRYDGGAQGSITGNEITGQHRVGILARDTGTDALIQNNTVEGSGPKSTGWAENGIQVSSGATADIKHNTVDNHWWNLNNFVSSGIIIYGSSDVNIQHNSLSGNDAAIVSYFGDGNQISQNTVLATHIDGDVDILTYGVIVFDGDNIHVVNNNLDGGSHGDVGAYVALAPNAKVIRNIIANFDTPYFVDGDGTKVQANVTPGE